MAALLLLLFAAYPPPVIVCLLALLTCGAPAYTFLLQDVFAFDFRLLVRVVVSVLVWIVVLTYLAWRGRRRQGWALMYIVCMGA